MATQNQNNPNLTPTPAPSEAGTKSSTGGDHGQAHAQKVMDEDTDKGYHGSVPDETPNENYTVAGVTADKPTPETTVGEDKK